MGGERGSEGLKRELCMLRRDGREEVWGEFEGPQWEGRAGGRR